MMEGRKIMKIIVVTPETGRYRCQSVASLAPAYGIIVKNPG
jgi:hypothetical protein